MKTFLRIFLVVSIILSSFSAIGFASEEKVEITFCVGDDTLSINGKDVKVEKPYVVGDGVTLVPLRVITEAFGAKVGWEDSTKTVTLSYPDVEIILQIGNPVAEVNKKAVTLLAAPELPSSTTMVPLRFISETFGALVNYDEKTEKITVVKETSATGSTIVQGAIESKRIGDSFYGWSMENPVGMTMSDRNFKGTETTFSFDDDNFFVIDVAKTEDNYNFDADYGDFKSSFKDYTLTKADKDVSEPSKKKMHFQAKNKEMFIEAICFATEKYIYTLTSICDVKADKEIKEISAWILTFVPEYTLEDTHDLSNVKEGFRRYESKTMKFSFDVPVEFSLISSENVENELTFANNDEKGKISSIDVGIYSKSQAGTAEELAKKDYAQNKESFNKDVVTIDAYTKQRSYNSLNAHEYSLNINAEKYKATKRDVFFEVGEYVYNISIAVKNPDAMVDHKIDNIINSIKAEALDPSTVGILMRNDPEFEGERTVKGEGWSITVSNMFADASADNTVLLQNKINGIVLAISSGPAGDISVPDLDDIIDETIMRAKGEGAKIISHTRSTYLGKISCCEATYKLTKDEITAYTRTIVGIHAGKRFVIIVSASELVYTEKAMQEITNMLKTLVVE